MSVSFAGISPKPLALAKPLHFGAQFDQSQTLKAEADAFATRGTPENTTQSVVPLINLRKGVELNSLLSVEVLDPGGDDKTPKTKRPLIDGQTLLAWAKNYHWKQDRVSDDFWTQRLNPLIALAAGIAHKSYNGDTGFGSLDLKPLFLEFPRVVEAIASKLPDKILALNTEGAKQAGLSPIFDFLAQNIDKYYVHDNKAFLIDNSDQ